MMRPNFVLVPLACAAVTLALVEAAAADGPSFNCSRAAAPDEKAICADSTLSQLDLLAASAYRAFSPEFQPKKTIARALLADRAACADDKTCILTAQYSALETYGGAEPWVRSLVVAALSRRASAVASGGSVSRQPPAELGACARTRITSVSTRFGEPVTYENEDAGTALGYADGLDLITYERESAFYGEKPGNTVIVCLMSVPHDCPTGDDRGRFYYSYDPLTKAEWTLPDSQHMCGGA